MTRHRIFDATLASIYPLYIAKVEKKGRAQAEVDEVICWLTGYDRVGLRNALESEATLEEFFTRAPALNPKASLITGLVCGHRVEDIEDPLMQQIRWMDKLVDEISRGKKMTSILRASSIRASEDSE